LTISLFLDRWSEEFGRLVFRFRNIITGLFFGHTHFDEFKVFLSPQTSEPVNVAYLSPSQTPHDRLNPAYRIYILDGKNLPNNLWHERYFIPLFSGPYNGTSNLLIDHQTYWYKSNFLNITLHVTSLLTWV